MNLARAGALALGLAGAFVSVGCTSNPYFIGALCPPGDGTTDPCRGGGTDAGSGPSFAVDLDQSGASRLGESLELPGGAIPATLRLRGERATASEWPSDQGSLLRRAMGTPTPGLEAPFTDETSAVGLATDAPAYAADDPTPGSVDADDAVFELVFRTAPGVSAIDKRGTGTGWSLATTSAGELALELRDGQRSATVVSAPLVARAWYHCLVWMSRGGARADCNGREGAAADLGALGSLASSANLAPGGGDPTAGAGIAIAHFALFRAPHGALGEPATWSAVGRRRFAELTGARPRVALGSALPKPDVRDSAAYVDLERKPGSARRLFLVGPDWPRIACRSDAVGARACGFLSEANRARTVPADASGWAAGELTVAPRRADFADGERRMEGLVPSTAAAPHLLRWTGTYAGARQSLSFFARGETGQFVGAAVSNRGTAVFDLKAGTASAPAGTRAAIEPWGDGLFRCSYTFEPDAGSVTYAVQLLGPAQAESFAGDGASAWIDVAGLQLDVGQAYAGSLMGADSEAADQLSFVADDGNLPAAGSVSLRCRMMLPAGPRLTDQAVLNLNRGGAFETQVQLYLTGDTGLLKFWGLQDGATHWAFSHPGSPLDGLLHAVEARWSPTSAELLVDGVSAIQEALIANDPPFSLDRIDVGFSSKSSGALEGLVAGVEIGTFDRR
jgi:hypothetical protein